MLCKNNSTPQEEISTFKNKKQLLYAPQNYILLIKYKQIYTILEFFML